MVVSVELQVPTALRTAGFPVCAEHSSIVCGMPLSLPVSIRCYLSLRLAIHRFCAEMLVFLSNEGYRSSDLRTLFVAVVLARS